MKIIKIGAVWCPECLVMRPVWEEIERGMPELISEYFDADENSEVIKKYAVENIPTFIFFDENGNEILRLEGMQDKDKLLKLIEAHGNL